eukprot:14938220-Alexandrium_andersonii.AAC.1
MHHEVSSRIILPTAVVDISCLTSGAARVGAVHSSGHGLARWGRHARRTPLSEDSGGTSYEMHERRDPELLLT